jgi:putative glycosyltransferase (TIGR04372 family)
MDIYLGAKCAFCVSTATGWDAVPLIFRRPIVYVNMSPAGYFQTFRDVFLGIFKHHLDLTSNRKLSLVEIFSRGVGFCVVTPEYESEGVYLIENTPEEIRDVVIEMVERLKGTWQPQKDDEALQRRFWEIFPTDAVDAYQGRPLHAEIRARFGSVFLRNNRSWLE